MRQAEPVRSECASTGLISAVAWSAPWVGLMGLQVALGAPCPLLEHTGLDCALCGSTRAAMAVLDGRLLDALDHNFGLLFVLPTLAVMAALRSFAQGRLPLAVKRTGVLELVVLWTAIRNVPWLPYFDSSLVG